MGPHAFRIPVLTLSLHAGEAVAANVRLVRGSSTMARATSELLRPGPRRLVLPLGENVTAGAASITVTFEDAGRNKLVIQRPVEVPR